MFYYNELQLNLDARLNVMVSFLKSQTAVLIPGRTGMVLLLDRGLDYLFHDMNGMADSGDQQNLPSLLAADPQLRSEYLQRLKRIFTAVKDELLPYTTRSNLLTVKIWGLNCPDEINNLLEGCLAIPDHTVTVTSLMPLQKCA